MFRFQTSTAVARPAASLGLAARNYSRPLVAVPARFKSGDSARVPETGSPIPRISDRIKHDHHKLEQQYNQIVTTSNDHDTQVRWQNQFIWELARHSIAEEIVVYPAFENLWADLSKHIKEEEAVDMPALEKAIDEKTSGQLAGSFDTTKHFVPTHSHPSAPDTWPYESAVGLLTAPMDKLRDMFKKFPKEEAEIGL
ncbi:hypothetical protein B0H66DRAFT_601288 [Apodospora peruviana]|uniref:Hemerythrin-like domain-containing protein n=1 Tax=Apodospora peruviana TaxID=516989 RepID=A0AAE0IBT6_9PEZI|nr:hypothetical protein B0H66DRAFT_601288 [Apodospora peruviana]